jgi:hypothetical protein
VNLCAISLPGESEPVAVIPPSGLPTLLEALAEAHPGVAFEVWEAGTEKPVKPRINTNGYVNRKCRCARCRESWTAYVAQRKRERIAEVAAGVWQLEHGRYSIYNNWGCRCDECRSAWRDYLKSYRNRHKT